MGRFFNIDSPIMHFLGRVADLMILNLVTLICCLPVVTIGASLTAMHYVLLKMVRNRESYIVRSFFKSFKANFKQATIIWMIILLLLVVFIMDLRIINDSSLGFPQVLKIMVYALLMVAYMVICYVFPVLSRFENTVVKTMKNALFMAILSFPKTVLMMVVYLLPLAIAYFVVAAVPVVFLFGLSVPETGEGIDMTED